MLGIPLWAMEYGKKINVGIPLWAMEYDLKINKINPLVVYS